MSTAPTQPLNFTPTDNTSWQRANPLTGFLMWDGWFTYHVVLEDATSDEPHKVKLATEDGKYIGHCDCKGYEYNDGPCAHLNTIHKAEFLDIVDVRSVDEAKFGQCPNCEFPHGGNR